MWEKRKWMEVIHCQLSTASGDQWQSEVSTGGERQVVPCHPCRAPTHPTQQTGSTGAVQAIGICPSVLHSRREMQLFTAQAEQRHYSAMEKARDATKHEAVSFRARVMTQRA
jgi:hypothetical protein